VNRKLRSEDVLDHLFNLFAFLGIPEHIRSDSGFAGLYGGKGDQAGCITVRFFNLVSLVCSEPSAFIV
jgi:hypothetical protein